MTFLTDLTAVLQNSNNALAGVFLHTNAKEIVALVEAAESIAKNTCCEGCQEAKLVAQKALAALNKNPPKEIDPNKWAFDRGLESY